MLIRRGDRCMDVSERRQNGVVILSMKGRLDSSTSDEFEKNLLALVGSGEARFILDLKELDYISSAGLRVLLKAAKELKRKDGRICLCSVKDYVREIFEMSGFVAFLPIHSNVEDSLSAIS